MIGAVLVQPGMIKFYFQDHLIFELPLFLLLKILFVSNPETEKDEEYKNAKNWMNGQDKGSNTALINYFQNNINWDQIDLFVVLCLDTKSRIRCIWESKTTERDDYRIDIGMTEIPKEVFRYMPANTVWINTLFNENNLYLSCPRKFNDPYDCNLDGTLSKSIGNIGICCFSKRRDSTLMYSHYADKHKGVCIGFDTVKLVESLTELSSDLSAHLRPVLYYIKMPPFEREREMALYLTCKNADWSYEEEYRLFMVDKKAHLQSGGYYKFNPDSITSLILGVKCDYPINSAKEMTSNFSTIVYKAYYEPKNFCMGIRSV